MSLRRAPGEDRLSALRQRVGPGPPYRGESETALPASSKRGGDKQGIHSCSSSPVTSKNQVHRHRQRADSSGSDGGVSNLAPSPSSASRSPRRRAPPPQLENFESVRTHRASIRDLSSSQQNYYYEERQSEEEEGEEEGGEGEESAARVAELSKRIASRCLHMEQECSRRERSQTRLFQEQLRGVRQVRVGCFSCFCCCTMF